MMTPQSQSYASGQRRLTPESRAGDIFARAFPGFAEDRMTDLRRLINQAGPLLGLNPTHMHLLNKLLSFSQAQDWLPGRRPIVWPSNQTLMDELGLCRRAIQYHTRKLLAVGLIAAHDSPTGKRYGRRDDGGAIIEAYGFDLSPIGARYDELQALVEAEQDRRDRRNQLRKGVTIEKKKMAQLLDAILSIDPEALEWRERFSRSAAQAKLFQRLDDVPALQDAVSRLQLERTAMEAHFDALVRQHSVDKSTTTAHDLEDNSPQGASFCTPTNTKTASLRQNCREAVQEGRSEVERPKPSLERLDLEKYQVTPGMVRYAAEGFGAFLPERPSWTDIVDAASMFRPRLGISQDAWASACRAMGRRGAAVAIAVISARRADIKSPGGFLRGMTERAMSGELNLGRSIHGLRRKRQIEERGRSRQH